MDESENRLIAAPLDRPRQGRAVPFGVTPIARHHHTCARCELVDGHAKDHFALIEPEFGLSANLLVDIGIRRPPVASWWRSLRTPSLHLTGSTQSDADSPCECSLLVG